MNKISSSCEICSGPHDTQYCMENPEQAFVEYASLSIDEARGLVSNFMASQDARLSKFEADFKQQQGEMTNKINPILKAITDRMVGPLPSETVKNLKLNVNSTSLVLSTRSYPTEYHQCSTRIHSSINAIMICSKQPDEPQDNKPESKEQGDAENINNNPPPPLDPSMSLAIEKVHKLNSILESLSLIPQSSNTKFVCTKEDDGEVMFIKIIRDHDNPLEEEDESAVMEGLEVEYFDMFPTRNELAYHIYLMSGSSLRKAYIDLNSSLNIMTHMHYNWIMRRKLEPGEDQNGIRGVRVVRFTDGSSEIAYKMSHKIEQYNSLTNMEKEHTKSMYFKNEEDREREVEYVMNKILGFYKECLELGPEYLTGLDDEGEFTKSYLLEDKQIPSLKVEELMPDVATTKEEITRWKAAKQQEAKAGSVVKQEYVSRIGLHNIGLRVDCKLEGLGLVLLRSHFIWSFSRVWDSPLACPLYFFFVLTGTFSPHPQKLPFAVTSVDGDNLPVYYSSIDLASPSPSNKHKSRNMKRSLSNEEPQAETSRLRAPKKGHIQLVLSNPETTYYMDTDFISLSKYRPLCAK
ncbi:hypothetical protein Tco_0073453, partial [Tanacetum coccineum]